MYILCRSCCCCLVAKSCLTFCNPMNCRKPGLPVLHNFPEFAQNWWCHPTISSCHPLLLLPSIFPSIRIFSNESALLVRWPNIGASASASVLSENIQGWFPLGLTGLISLQSKGLSRIFFNTTVWKHQFLGAQPFFFFWSSSHIRTWLLEKSFLWLDRPSLAKWCLCFLIC